MLYMLFKKWCLYLNNMHNFFLQWHYLKKFHIWFFFFNRSHTYSKHPCWFQWTCFCFCIYFCQYRFCHMSFQCADLSNGVPTHYTTVHFSLPDCASFRQSPPVTSCLHYLAVWHLLQTTICTWNDNCARSDLSQSVPFHHTLKKPPTGVGYI